MTHIDVGSSYEAADGLSVVGGTALTQGKLRKGSGAFQLFFLDIGIMQEGSSGPGLHGSLSPVNVYLTLTLIFGAFGR